LKEGSPNQQDYASDLESEEEKVLPRFEMKNLEIRELKVDLKENELNMKEGNIKAKRIKLREMEETVESQKQDQDDKKKELEEKKQELDEREANVEKQKENLKRLYFEVNEKNAIMEIVLKMRNRTEKLSINLDSSSPALHTSGDNSGTELLLLQERVRELEEREASLRRLQENLDQREIQLEEKRMILEIAIRINDFSNESKLLALSSEENNPGEVGASSSSTNSSNSGSGSGSSTGSGTGSNERISSAGEENSESLGNSS